MRTKADKGSGVKNSPNFCGRPLWTVPLRRSCSMYHMQIFTVEVREHVLSSFVIYSCMQLAVELSLAVPVTNALTLVFTAIAGRLIGEDVGPSMYI